MVGSLQKGSVFLVKQERKHRPSSMENHISNCSITSPRIKVTEPAVFVHEVAKQHDIFFGAIASGILASARASF